MSHNPTAPLTVLTPTELQLWLRQWPAWRLEEGKLKRDLQLRDFREALQVLMQLGELAEVEGYYPDFHLWGYRNLRLELFTHDVDGISQRDISLASKMEAIMAVL